MFASIKLFGACVVAWFGPASGAIRAHLNVAELLRIALTAAVTGGGLYGALEGIAASSGAVFPLPGEAALATTILTLVVEAWRRTRHGAPLPPPKPPRLFQMGQRNVA